MYGPIALPAPKPTIFPETASFWAHAARGELVLQRCDRCADWVFYPRPFCPNCGSSDLTETVVSGRGLVYTYSIVRRGLGDFAQASPYVLAYVELGEGPRLLTNIVGCPPAEVHIGQPVEVVFAPIDESAALPRFRPVASADDGSVPVNDEEFRR